MSNVTLSGRLKPMKTMQSDELERVEMNVHRGSWGNAQYRQRLPVTVVTAYRRFEGGHSAEQKWNTLFVLRSSHRALTERGEKISLTRLLKDVGIEIRDQIDVRLIGEDWVIPDRRVESSSG